MQVNSFTIEGYKNLTTAVTLGPLGPVGVMYGPNNIGKSNLLAAIDLFFGLLGVGSHVSKDQSVSMDPSEQIAGHPFDQIFHASDPQPIRLQAELSLPEEELRQSGVEPECATNPTTITLELTPVASGAQLKVTQFQMGTQDVARDGSGPVGFGETLRALIAGTFFMSSEGSVRPFALVDPYHFSPEDGIAAGLVPQRLLDALFDARQSLDGELRGRWGLFQQAMRALEPELGRGEFDTAFDRSTGCANLVFSAGDTTMAVARLGAGVQRMVAVVGAIALARATVVGLGEPELGLSPLAQQRLLRAVRAILGAPIGPTQLLFTTHSPVLGGTEGAFSMEYEDGARIIVQRAWEGAGALPPLEDLSRDGSVGGPAPGDLDQLIGLVDQLAEIEPDALVTAAPGTTARSAGQRAVAPRPSGQEKPDATPPGTPSWKWQANEKQ